MRYSRTLLSSSATESSILDLRLYPNDDSLFITAQSTGSIIVWRVIEEESRVEQVKEYQLYDEDVLVLSVAFSGVDPNLVSATLSSGEVSLVKVTPQELTVLGTKQAHSLEAWTSNFGSGVLGNAVFSGGDDSCLISHDTRSFEETTIWNRRLHDAGITAILPSQHNWKQDDPFCLWTGGYDDRLRSIDLRTQGELQPYLIPRCKDDIDLGGGVWRLIPNGHDNRVLACCMYGGARILDPDSTFCSVVRTFTNGHESMVYGGDWADNDSVLTCSFYDKQLQKWSATESV